MAIYEIIWTDHKSKKDYIIGLLVYDKYYIFRYNQEQIDEVIKKGFRPFIEFPHIKDIYLSKKLFRTFAIRIHGLEKEKIKNISDNGAQLATDQIKIYRRMDVNRK